MDQLLGPYGALIGAVAGLGILGRVIQMLWREHKAADARDQERAKQAEDRLDAALAAMKETNDLTDRALAVNTKMAEIAGRALDRLEDHERSR